MTAIASTLCDANCVRLLRRVDADAVSAMVDDGRLQWVFDVSANAPRSENRELRFWVDELINPQLLSYLSLREVIDRILPVARTVFRGFEIVRLLMISRQTLQRIAPQMGAVIRNHTFDVSRAAFAAWLEARWIGRVAQ